MNLYVELHASSLYPSKGRLLHLGIEHPKEDRLYTWSRASGILPESSVACPEKQIMRVSYQPWFEPGSAEESVLALKIFRAADWVRGHGKMGDAVVTAVFAAMDRAKLCEPNKKAFQSACDAASLIACPWAF